MSVKRTKKLKLVGISGVHVSDLGIIWNEGEEKEIAEEYANRLLVQPIFIEVKEEASK
jgi:hypothetical protein